MAFMPFSQADIISVSVWLIFFSTMGCDNAIAFAAPCFFISFCHYKLYNL